jgi:nitrite reductase/ring-hydroxylating ferredoxin subunit/uncharacterized membrane protein
MDSRKVVDLVEQQDWLDPVADAIQKPASKVLDADNAAARTTRDFLHGKWMGHPFHAAMTDVPIGAWTVAAVLDLSSSPAMKKGADAAIGIGVAAAGVTAAAGIADYHMLGDKRTKRLGAMHALLNVGVTALYIGSMVARARGNRPLGKALGWTAYGILGVSSYLGGALVYDRKVGVNHSPESDSLPSEWVHVCSEGEIEEGVLLRKDVDGTPLVFTKQEGRIYALAASCAHFGGPLDEGKIEGDCVVCPWHASKFRFEDGKCMDGPSAYNQPALQVRIANGQVEVKFDKLEQEKQLAAARNPYLA